MNPHLPCTPDNHTTDFQTAPGITFWNSIVRMKVEQLKVMGITNPKFTPGNLFLNHDVPAKTCSLIKRALD